MFIVCLQDYSFRESYSSDFYTQHSSTSIALLVSTSTLRSPKRAIPTKRRAQLKPIIKKYCHGQDLKQVETETKSQAVKESDGKSKPIGPKSMTKNVTLNGSDRPKVTIYQPP